MQEIRSNNNAVFRLFYHLVLVTKYRRKVLTPAILARAIEILRATAAMLGCVVIEAEGEADHIHVLFEALPRHAPSSIVNSLKTVCARRLRSEFGELRRAYRRPVLWSPSYCVLSAGGVPPEILKRYIDGHRAGPGPA